MQRDYPFLPAVVAGQTADIYFHRTLDTLRRLGRDPVVTMAVFPGRRSGVMAGVDQVLQLLREAAFDGELKSLTDGDRFEARRDGDDDPRALQLLRAL